MVESLSDRLQRMLSKGRDLRVLSTLGRGRSQLGLPASEGLFLVVCFIGVSHILDFFFFFFCLGISPLWLWKYGSHEVYCTNCSPGGSGENRAEERAGLRIWDATHRHLAHFT